MTTLSLLRCDGCGQVTGDATRSRRDDKPRCGPCGRRADHHRRLTAGDRWYREQIIYYATWLYGAEWEREHGWDFCAGVFADARALGGWQAVGVEDFPWERPGLLIVERPCPDCGETTTSFTNYFCAGCHFGGWWGRWHDDGAEETPAA